MLKRMIAAAVLGAALMGAGVYVYAETAAPAGRGAAVTSEDGYYGCPGWQAARNGDNSWRCPGWYGNRQ